MPAPDGYLSSAQLDREKRMSRAQARATFSRSHSFSARGSVPIAVVMMMMFIGTETLVTQRTERSFRSCVVFFMDIPSSAVCLDSFFLTSALLTPLSGRAHSARPLLKTIIRPDLPCSQHCNQKPSQERMFMQSSETSFDERTAKCQRASD